MAACGDGGEGSSPTPDAGDDPIDTPSDAGDFPPDPLPNQHGGEVVLTEENGLRVATFTTAAFTVGPTEERFVCQNFGNPFSADVAIVKSISSMKEGSHHMFAFQRAATDDGPLEDCSGLEFGPAAHSSQAPERTVEYPDGVARIHPATDGIRIQAHYFNSTSEPIEARVTVKLYTTVPAGKELSASLFFNNLGVSVAPNTTGFAERTCTLPQPIKLMNAISHMHQYGTNFVAKLGDGTTLFETTEWAEPEARDFDPPLELPAGTTITFRCDYDNTSSEMLTFGESARSNEMCIFAGQFYPAPNGGITCM